MPFADENFFATSAEITPAAKKHFGTQSHFPRLCAATKVFAHKQSGMFLSENLIMNLRNVFSAFQEKINGERFFFSLAHLMYKEG